ncbi:MAG: helicase-exonuclease AddAB subunit AddB [Lachnospiraceae bacterium]|nr:helicase-exonuclease AddAB subunit AddB [Lachnospiraceae bacterium]
MSLRFVFGSSGAGKSTRLYTEILKRAEAEPERNFLIIVPDQFTMQTQKELVTHPVNKRKGILNIDVLSFGRLSHRIFEEVGKREIPVLDDTGKSLVLRRVAGSLKDSLPYLGAHMDKQGYIHEVKSAISEFMQYGISVEDVGQLMSYAEKRGALYYKLKDLKLLYQGFKDYIREKFITTEETLDLLREALGRSRIIKDSVIVFDGFTGFTPIQNKVIQELMKLTREVILTITLDLGENPFEPDGEQKLFHLSKKTVADLVKLAADAGVERGGDIYVNYGEAHRFSHNAPIAHLERSLFRYPLQTYEAEVGEQIHLFAASSIREEIRQTGILIQKLLRDKGYQYRDIAVVTGDLEAYGELLQTEFLKLEIPCFLDRTRGIVLNPLTEYIKSAFEIIIQDFSYESIFRYLRSGLADFAPEEVDMLENYAIATGIRGKRKWMQQFTRKTDWMGERVEPLLALEQMRGRLIEELTPLLLSGRNTSMVYVEALYRFLTKNRAPEKLAVYEAMFTKNQDLVRAKEYAQVYRLVMELLEQVAGLLAEETMDIREFLDILEAGFGEIQVGTIPQNVDRILVGDIERTRLKEVKVLFFMGVNDGNIPRSGGKGGIISDIDREFLRASDLELAPSPRQQMYIQRLYLYLNMTKPSDALYLSFSKTDGEGKALRPAYLVEMLQTIFPLLVFTYPETEPALSQIFTPREGLPYLAEALRNYADGLEGENREVFTLYEAYRQKEEYATLLQKLTDAAFYRYEQGQLPAQVAKALYGQILINSVSRLETYAACAYRHFLQYGLALKEREGFVFESVDMGNVFHGVLEGFSHKLEESPYTWFDFSEDFASRTVGEVLSLYAAQYGATILYDNARNEYALKRMERILNRTVMTLQYQLRKGRFRPESYEMSFSSVSDLDSVNIVLSEEEKMKLLGRIDRVDTFEEGNKLYVKIVDYKSGGRKFDLAALYYGLQLQLVVYMNAAMDKEKREHPDKEVVPAALLYYHVTDPMTQIEEELTPEEINARLLQELRAGGIVNSNEEIIRSLDGESDGKSDVIPVEYKKDGSLSSRSSVMTGEELQTVSEYVNQKVRELGREILSGRISVDPYEKGAENACTYCAFTGVCGFDKNTPGYAYRRLKSMDKDEAMDCIRGGPNGG